MSRAGEGSWSFAQGVLDRCELLGLERVIKRWINGISGIRRSLADAGILVLEVGRLV